MEKSLCFVAAFAFSCAGLPTALGQVNMPSAGSRPVYLVNQTGQDGQQGVSDEGSLEVPNPFDLFDDQADAWGTSSSSNDGLLGEVPPTGLESTTGAEIVSSPSDSSASGLPVYAQGRGVVETIHDQAVIASVPHATFAPVHWSGYVQSPNPIAQHLLRDECYDSALWVGYPAQRAAECAHMWRHVHRLQQAEACGHGHCGQGACGTCGTTKPRNRYLTTRSHAGGCTTADCDASVVTPVAQPLPTPAAPLPPAEVRQTNAPAGESAESGRFAFLPLPVR